MTRTRDTVGPGIFTDYLRSLGPGGDPPSPEVFAEVFEALRGVLVGELKRKGLWSLPPSYVGVFGHWDWRRRESESASLDSSLDQQPALFELVTECYTFIFIQRMQSLRAQLRIKANIEGLIFRNVRNFVFERQRRYDPLGYRVFSTLRLAIRDLVENNDLEVVSGNPKISNETVLATRTGGTGKGKVGDSSLAEMVRNWCDDLLPELITTHGRGHSAVRVRLGDHLRSLAIQNIGPFTFKSVVDPFKSEVRARWASTLEHADDPTLILDPDRGYSRIVTHLRPGVGLEARESFETLVDCVDQSIGRVDTSSKTRLYLETLYYFLLAQVVDTNPSPALSAAGGAIQDVQIEGGDLLSRRKVARLLKIPRDRLPSLYDALGKMVTRCKEKEGPVDRPEGRSRSMPEAG